MNNYVGLRQLQNQNPSLKWEDKMDFDIDVDASMAMMMELLSSLTDLFLLLPIV